MNNQFTKKALVAELKAQMATVPFEKISITQLVNAVGIQRNTFYYYFNDKYEVLQWIFTSELNEILAGRNITEQWPDTVARIEQYLHQNRGFYQNALRYRGQNCLEDYALQYVRALSCTFARRHGRPAERAI